MISSQKRISKATKEQELKRVRSFLRKQPWDKWWDEFATKMNSQHQLQYKTAYQFANAKGTTAWEKKTLYGAIGPCPYVAVRDLDPAPKKAQDSRPIDILWYGDWDQRRQSGFWFGNERAKALHKVLEERQTALDAARGVAGISVEYMERLLGVQAQVDQYFNGQVLRDDLTPADNEKRFALYMDMTDRVLRRIEKAQETFLMCHGIHSDDLAVLAQMFSGSLQNALGAVAKGAATGASIGTGISNTALLLARTLQEKSVSFGLPLPQPPKDVTREEEAPPSNPDRKQVN